MMLQIYALAFMFRDRSIVAQELAELREKIRNHEIDFEIPKMGDHLTILPPFHAEPEHARYLAGGLDIARALMMPTRKMTIRFTRPGFFRAANPSGKDTLVLHFETSEELLNIAETWRSKIAEDKQWVYPIESYLYNPHVAVGEGHGLYQKTQDVNIDRWFKELSEFSEEVTLPFIMRKDLSQKQWVPVRF